MYKCYANFVLIILSKTKTFNLPDPLILSALPMLTLVLFIIFNTVINNNFKNQRLKVF